MKFYKKKWFKIVIVLLLFSWTYQMVKPAEQEQDVKNVEDVAEAVEEVEEEEVINMEHEEVFGFAEFTIENIKTEIIDNELKLRFNWINQSGRDDTPFTVVGYLDITQGEEILKAVSDNDLIRRSKNGVSLPVRLTYEIDSSKPISILFGATHSVDNREEELIIEVP